MSGIAADPQLPKPVLSLNLAEPRSAQQGTVIVSLDSASRGSGTGTLTLEFRAADANANDPGITFQTGSRSISFTVSPGDTQPLVAPFQTGTTAGTLTFTVAFGTNTAQQSLTIPGAAVGISSVQGSRLAGNVELRITGFDNTRTAGATTYTFFDTAGNAVPPGAIQINSTADFTRFFQSSDAGGTFQLRAMFPVTGDASRIAAFEVEFTNSAGTARTSRTVF